MNPRAISEYFTGMRPCLHISAGLLALAMTLGCACPVAAQAPAASSQIVVEPLFDYPAPPEEMENLQQRSEWVLEHFWDKMDLKSKQTVDQNALNHAFGIYALAMQWASPAAIDNSVGSLLKKLAKNPALTVQFTKAAEENLYGPRAALWGDDIYANFLRAASGNKKIDKSRREKYAAKLKRIESSAKGHAAPSFRFVKPDGSEGRYFPMATPTLIVFGNPDTPDMRLTRLRMETNMTFSKLLDDGKVNVLFILPETPGENWTQSGEGFPAKMTLGASAEAAEAYDLKMDPACYVIDSDGRIAEKNLDIDTAVITLGKLVN